MSAPDTYRGWTIVQGRWPEPAWMATGPNYDAWTEGEGEWRDNGHRADASTRESLIIEIDAWFDENAECSNSPDGRHQVDTSMESGPNNCFHCEAPMRRMGDLA